MIFFTRDLHRGYQPNNPESVVRQSLRVWARNVRIYAEYLKVIRLLLPVSGRDFLKLTLHDTKVVSAKRRGTRLTLKLDGAWGWGRERGYLITLDFLGVKTRQPVKSLLGQSWLYEEVHLAEDSRFAIHAMFDRSELQFETAEVRITRKRLKSRSK